MKFIDMIGVSLIAIGITLTVMSFIAARGGTSEVRSVTIQEIHPDHHDNNHI